MIDPTAEQLAALSGSAHEGPVQMINLLRFAEDGGRAGYELYAAEALPLLGVAGAHVVAMGSVCQTVIGEHERPWWDAILTVEYPSVTAFLTMVTSEGYQAIAHHRSRALERAELVATAPGGIG